MIVVYETAGCLSCRKAKAWLEEKGLDYRTVNTDRTTMSQEEIKHLIKISGDLGEVISQRSNVITGFKRTYGYELEELTFNQLVRFIQTNPSAMKRPIITDGKRLVSGFDEEELTVFLPREKRLGSIWYD